MVKKEYLLNHESQHMRGNISVMSIIVILVLVKELVQNLNDWQWCLIVLAQGNVVGNALTVIFENTVKVNETEEKQVGVAPYVLYDVEEAIEHIF